MDTRRAGLVDERSPFALHVKQLTRELNAREIVEAQGGTPDVGNRAGAGMIVRVWLPGQ
jgi:hypothetical protein